MNLLAMGVPALFYLLVIGLCGFLVWRGVSHLFVALFAVGALLHLLQTMGYIAMSRMPGGFGAYTQYLPWFAIIGAIGTVVLAAAFVAMTLFLLQTPERAS